MRNRELAADYVVRADIRLKAIDVLFEAASWADVVRESQEAVELALKGLLRDLGIEPPRVHDVSDVLLSARERVAPAFQDDVERLAAISRDLRRDRELAFDGAEDLTPSGFYGRDDAARARDGARFVVRIARSLVLEDRS
jgi:HEPN domain-containing protein